MALVSGCTRDEVKPELACPCAAGWRCCAGNSLCVAPGGTCQDADQGLPLTDGTEDAQGVDGGSPDAATDLAWESDLEQVAVPHPDSP
ncbi:MAG: hypothetical protein JRH20_33010, partial [Deltaproteobacteria bacterium]|nr:hypothetical protein [Deltaproteobacteria bacterium]